MVNQRMVSQGSGVGQGCRLVYDGECRLCVETKRQLELVDLSQDTDIRFVPYQSDEAKQALGTRYLPGCPDAAFLVKPTGEVCEGLEAFLPFVPNLPGGRGLLWLFRFPLVKKTAAFFYRVIARHRYRLFGKVRPSCSER